MSEILYFMYSPQDLYSSYAGNYLRASQMQNKIRYRKTAKILDLYLEKYNIPLFYLAWWASIINMNEYSFFMHNSLDVIKYLSKNWDENLPGWEKYFP
jgi:hypothetical protein